MYTIHSCLSLLFNVHLPKKFVVLAVRSVRFSHSQISDIMQAAPINEFVSLVLELILIDKFIWHAITIMVRCNNQTSLQYNSMSIKSYTLELWFRVTRGDTHSKVMDIFRRRASFTGSWIIMVVNDYWENIYAVYNRTNCWLVNRWGNWFFIAAIQPVCE